MQKNQLLLLKKLKNTGSAQLWIFSDSRKPFAKIFIFEDDISIFGHKR